MVFLNFAQFCSTFRRDGRSLYDDNVLLLHDWAGGSLWCVLQFAPFLSDLLLCFVLFLLSEEVQRKLLRHTSYLRYELGTRGLLCRIMIGLHTEVWFFSQCICCLHTEVWFYRFWWPDSLFSHWGVVIYESVCKYLLGHHTKVWFSEITWI